jgi:hypothetical protein
MTCACIGAPSVDAAESTTATSPLQELHPPLQPQLEYPLLQPQLEHPLLHPQLEHPPLHPHGEPPPQWQFATGGS